MCVTNFYLCISLWVSSAILPLAIKNHYFLIIMKQEKNTNLKKQFRDELVEFTDRKIVSPHFAWVSFLRVSADKEELSALLLKALGCER